jgi:hypothetical protein
MMYQTQRICCSDTVQFPVFYAGLYALLLFVIYVTMVKLEGFLRVHDGCRSEKVLDLLDVLPTIGINQSLQEALWPLPPIVEQDEKICE